MLDTLSIASSDASASPIDFNILGEIVNAFLIRRVNFFDKNTDLLKMEYVEALTLEIVGRFLETADTAKGTSPEANDLIVLIRDMRSSLYEDCTRLYTMELENYHALETRLNEFGQANNAEDGQQSYTNAF